MMTISSEPVPSAQPNGVDPDHLPLVSVVIPCRNEEKFIGICLDSVLANDYPKDKFEVLVVDGISDDRTPEIVQAYSQGNPAVRLLRNERKSMPFASNIGISAAKGEIIIIMGAHARYDHDYISNCVAYQRLYDADNVGGIMRTSSSTDTLAGRSIAHVMSHRFGFGISTFRSGGKSPKWVDTVFGGCYPRRVFEKIGGFNETLTRTQDREFNQRLRDAGGKVLFVPEIRCEYFSRGTLAQFVKNLYSNGLWVFYGNRLGGRSFVAARNFVPLLFVMVMAAQLVAAPFIPAARYGVAAIALVYGLLAGAFALSFAIERRDPRCLVLVPLLFGLGHSAYGVGSMVGIVKSLRVRPGWAALPQIGEPRVGE